MRVVALRASNPPFGGHKAAAENEGGDMSHTRTAVLGTIAAATVSSLLAALLVATSGAAEDASHPRASSVAQAASVLNIHDEGRLHFVHASGAVIIDEGRVTGSFPGSVKVHFLYDGEPEVSAAFTIVSRYGSISARGKGTLSSPTSPSPSFRGRMTVTGGSGRYARVHGGGELFGVYYRRSYALTVQAIGKLPY